MLFIEKNQRVHGKFSSLLQVRDAIKEHLDDFKKTEIKIDEPKVDDTEFKGRITLSDGNSRNFHGYDLEDDLENIRLRGKPVWTDGIDEVYELTVSHDAYKVGLLLYLMRLFKSVCFLKRERIKHYCNFFNRY